MARRRGNNEGSIYRRENGTWRVQVTLDGQRLSFTAKTRQECQAWLKRINKQIDSGLSFNGANMKFSNYLDLWLNTVKENRSQKTYYQHQGLVRNYILPQFGEHRLQDLHPIQIERYLTQLKANGIGDRTCQLVYSTMYTALRAAVRKGLIGRNPLEAVEKPRVRNPKQKTVLDLEQVQRLLIAAQGERNEVLYHLAIVTGLREGEIFGLKWGDVDWQRSRLNIQRRAQRVPKVGIVFSSPKTKSGIRQISLGQITLNKLREHKQRQLSNVSKEL